MRLRALTAVGLVSLLAGAVVAHPAGASPALTLSKTSGPPTTTLTIAGTGFGPSEQVTIRFDETEMAIVGTDSQGAFAQAVGVPGTAAPGTHTISATGQTSGVSAEASFLVRTNWRQYRFDGAHTAVNPFENIIGVANAAALTEVWLGRATAPLVTAPAVVNGVVYVASAHYGTFRGRLYAFDASNGRRLWSQSTNGAGTPPAVSGGSVYVGSSSGKLYAFKTDGTMQWEAITRGPIESALLVLKGVVYVGSNDGKLYAFDKSTGRLLWSRRTGGAIRGSPSFAGGIVYVGSQDRKLYALNASTGAKLWAVTVGRALSTGAVADGVVYVTAKDGNLHALDASTGAQVWPPTPVGTDLRGTVPAVANGVIYVSGTDTTLRAVRASDGGLLWSFLHGFGLSAPVVANGVVYVGSTEEKLVAVNASTGALLRFTPGSGAGEWDPVVSDGVVYVGSNDSHLHAYSLP